MIYNKALSGKAPPVIGVAVAGIITGLNDMKREKIELAIDDWISKGGAIAKYNLSYLKQLKEKNKNLY